MYYDESYSNQGRFSFSSIVLLVIFVSAAALILAAIIWRPWSGSDESPVIQTITADQPDPNNAAADAANAGAVAPEAGAVPEVVTGP